jgi:hypothetical protein
LNGILQGLVKARAFAIGGFPVAPEHPRENPKAEKILARRNQNLLLHENIL